MDNKELLLKIRKDLDSFIEKSYGTSREFWRKQWIVKKSETYTLY